MERAPRGVTPREPPRGLRHRAVPAGEGRSRRGERGRGETPGAGGTSRIGKWDENG